MTLSALLTLAVLQFFIAASPGPATILTIKTAARDGLRAGLALALGLAVAIVLWAVAAITGLSVLFEIAPWLQAGLRVVGGLFLIWIGIQLWRGASAPLDLDAVQLPRSHGASMRLGVFTNLANPKALAYFAAVFTGILPTNPALADTVLILMVVFVVELFWYSIVATLFARPTARRLYQRIKAWIDRLFGALISAIGIRIAVQP